MKIIFLCVGSKHETYVTEGVNDFTRRINHYFPCEWKLISAAKEQTPLLTKSVESSLIMQFWKKADSYNVMLDERGRQLSSPQLAQHLEQLTVRSVKTLCFCIGGAFGVTEELRSMADLNLSFGTMVFPHQLIRLMLSEQVYRACTIIKGEKYHHI